MKKFFLIPLMTLVCSVMTWGSEVVVNDFATLKTQLSASGTADVVKLGQDIAYPTNGSDLLNIERSLTLDGQGHKISGYGSRGGQPNVISINYNKSSYVTVELKNLDIYSTQYRPLETRGYITKLTLDNVNVVSTGGTYNPQVLTIGGYQTEEPYAQLVIKNSSFNAGTSGYPMIFWNPTIVTMENTNIAAGYCGMYFKPGSHGCVVNADACNFDAPNVHSGVSNAFAVFPMEDTGFTFVLNNCGINGTHIGDQSQDVFLVSNEWFNADSETGNPISVTMSGDNAYYMTSDNLVSDPGNLASAINVTITGGTYSQKVNDLSYVTIPAGYEVKEIETQQGGLQTTLYRVRKIITTSESINDNVEGQGDGVNANTEFLISGDETVAADATVAHYVEVSNDATLTLPAGKELTVKNGLDVTDGAVLDVQAGSTLIVGEGGVTAESVNSIVVEADENGSASFLLDPEVIVNTTPNITIKMTAKGVGYEMDEEEQEYYWFRFAAPVAGIEAVGKVPERPTYFYKWDYAADQWNSISTLSELEPFQGFSLTTNHEGLEDVTYTFKGRLAGNQDMKLLFQSRGYNYFGNSYTGYIDVLALVQQLMENDAIDGTIYMWDNNNQRFKDVPLGDLTMADESWKREVAPMQTFILRQVNTGEPTSTEINYASAIWGNPRYGLVSAPAPARQRVNNDVAKLTIVVTSANGKIDEITFKESNEFSDEYNKGFDAVKFMNERQINLYSTIDGENLGTVATDNIEGKLISMQTVKALNYTMSFEDVNSDEYAIRDNVTGAVINITEGNTYEFAAQPNSVIEGRFEIVNRANAPTAIENTEVKANVKGIYTIMGQYLGENFDILPAGVYVVDGVKIVK